MRRSNFILSHFKYIQKLDTIQLWRHIKCNLLLNIGFLQLKKIFICPSHECNANCVHCYEKFNSDKFKKFLTTQQVKDIIDQFSRLGGYFIYFCTGEFLLRKDAIELVRYARYKRNMLVTIVTNGLLLDEKKIDELKKAGLGLLMVSIDSATASRHDQLRGVKGCFEKAVNGIRIAKKNGIITWISTYVTKTNFNELTEISKLGNELGINIFTFLPILSGHLFDRNDENITYEERQLFRKQFNRSSNVLLEFLSEKSKCRGGGLEHICVMPSGEVTFCPPVPYSYGNISTKSLRDCLKEIVKDYKRFSHCRGQCIVNFPEYRHNCNAKFIY